MKRILSALLLTVTVAAMSLNLAACDSGGGESSGSGSTEGSGLPDVEVANKELVMLAGLGTDISAFTSTNDKRPSGTDLIKSEYGVNLTFRNVDWNDYYSTLSSYYMADDMPDLLWPMPETLPKDIINNLIQPVSDYPDYIRLDDPIWDATRSYNEKFKMKGKTYYAFAGFSTAEVVMFNPKQFELIDEKTPAQIYREDPSKWTWDELQRLASKLKTDQQWGLAIGSSGPHMFQESTGVPFVEYDKDNNKIINNIDRPEIADAANYVRDLGATKHNVLSPVESYNAYTDFLNGSSAMVIDASYRLVGDYKELWKEGKIDFAPLPRYKSDSKNNRGAILWTFMIANKAKNPEAAALWIYLYRFNAAEKQYNAMFGEPTEAEKYQQADELQMPHEAFDLYQQVNNDYETFPITLNIWLGFYNKGWYNGFTDLQNEPWSTIVARIKPVFDNNITKSLDRWNAAIEGTYEDTLSDEESE